MDPECDFITLTGTAGTGKTLMTLAAGLSQVLDDRRYSEIIVTRVTVPVGEDFWELPAAPEGEDVLWDYASLGLTLRSHPMALLRAKLDRYKLKTSEELRRTPHGRTVRTAGIVTLRQRPQTASSSCAGYRG